MIVTALSYHDNGSLQCDYQTIYIIISLHIINYHQFVQLLNPPIYKNPAIFKPGVRLARAWFLIITFICESTV